MSFEEHSCPSCRGKKTVPQENIPGGAGWCIGVQWHCEECDCYFQIIYGRHNE
jgi:hypothetical protein